MTPASRRIKPLTPLTDRIERHLDRSSVPGCWLWTGHMRRRAGRLASPAIKLVRPDRMGSARVVKRNPRRLLWELSEGPLSQRADLLPACGSALCIRPAHMRRQAHATDWLPGSRRLIGCP